MPADGESAYNLTYRATGDEIQVREDLDDDEGVFELRMPIATTGEVRNEGDEPLTRDELNGMARQLDQREIGVFPAHGNDTTIAAGKYSPFERLGDWTNAAIESRDDENVLIATARMPDPETLPDLGAYREALGILKEQAKRGISQDSSIGWRDDESFPGGVDLMEVSIVGIGADWRTNMGDESAEVVARAAVEAGADAEKLVSEVRNAVESERTLGPPEDPDRFENFKACVGALSDDPELSEEDAEEICGAWEQGKEADADVPDHVLHNEMTNESDPDEGHETAEQDASDSEPEQAQITETVRQSPSEIADMAEDYVMGAVENAIDDLREDLEDMMGEENESDGDMDDDEDEDEDQSADEPESEQEADEEQDSDPETERESELAEELDSLREELAEIKEGGVSADDVETPETDKEQDGDDPDESRDTEGGFDNLGDYR
jgi:hypothetical protein